MKIDLTGEVKKVMDIGMNVNAAVQFILHKVAVNVVQNNAKINAPFLTGTLRSSITTDLSKLSQRIAVVGSPVPYAKIREYVNYKNPHRKFYLRRAYYEHINEIDNIVKETLHKELE